jgi:hypothetical protein
MGFNNKLQLKGEIFLPCKDYALNESINCPACNMIVIICIPVDQNYIKKKPFSMTFIRKTSVNRNLTIMVFLQRVSILSAFLLGQVRMGPSS